MKLGSMREESEKAMLKAKIRIMKKRLKKAREEAGYTQEKLAEVTGYSVKMIQYWEQGEKHLPKTEFLLYLAELYSCDLDYLTGRIDCKTHDLQFIHDQTGLSEEAIKKLQRIAFMDRATGNSQALSFMIEDPDFHYLLALMSQTAQGDLHAFSVGNAYIHTEKRAVIDSETRATFSRISDNVREKMEKVPSENRWIYNFAYGLHAEGRLTDEQLSEVIDHYDQGDFDFTPPGWSDKTDH